ncbi:hypothetical protein A8F94_09505 [Bacillus sp. FJAT-27225]|uniref:GGDEF domain-containing protein n=1 Tax=Bacillus sp. FJAT-27225 TaxID=1743144 RepID=UPI00080C2C1A|nr:diguanylate cyclase [Bacillus sp. FJAT-27225]OCA88048.1 hypothetical protein A8F94_09505 [Bacillus sp. FJAT-27225]
MYKDLISNIAILLSFLAVAGQLFRLKPMNSSAKMKLLGGIAAGIMGSVLMLFSVKVADHTIVDFRNFAVIIVSLYGGLRSGLVAAVIISMNRFLFFGVSPSSYTAFAVLMLLAFIGSYVARRNLSAFMKFNIVNQIHILLFCIAITFLVKDKALLGELYFFYGLFSFLGGMVICYMVEYIVRTNRNYRKLQESATKDFLTGLNNVRQFDEIWNREVSVSTQTGGALSLLTMDIDYFKAINDKFGHPDGDKILKQLAEILANAAATRGIAARNGGEEFSIILPGTAKAEAEKIAEQIRTKVADTEFDLSNKKKINITVSIGVASFPESTREINQLIQKADDCLYRAKKTGRNRVCA